MHIDFHITRREGVDLLLHALSHLLEHSRASRQNDVVVEIFAHIYITLHNALEGEFVDSIEVIIASQRRLEKQLRTLKRLRSHHHLPPVRELVLLVRRRVVLGHLHLVVEISGHVAHSFFDFSDHVQISGCREAVASVRE